MRDFAISEDPAVQAQLNRLGALSVPDGRLGLETIRALLDRLGNPHDRLPPVFHVAGTNGKGSTCAFLRAMLEAEGLTVHATTSPHLVRYNERIRVTGKLIEDGALATILAEVLDAGEDLNPSFFEVTIAASFLAFSRTPADACVIEVGLRRTFRCDQCYRKASSLRDRRAGHRSRTLLACPRAGRSQGSDGPHCLRKSGHRQERREARSRWLMTTPQHEAIADVADRVGAELRDEGRWWNYGHAIGGCIGYRDEDGTVMLPAPSLPGDHQRANCALAAAMVRHQDAVKISKTAMKEGARTAKWPARMQRLSPGPLIGEREIWLDGGHNPNAGEAIAAHFEGQQIHLILGMIAGKDPAAITEPLSGSIASLTVVPIEGQDFQPAQNFGPSAKQAEGVKEALASLPKDGLSVLIAGSLYLAGDVLKLTGELPD